jgi:predicted nuclease with TOPRIM domain
MDNSPIDVRIIVEGASDVESVSRAMQDVALGAEYHITISSIIPTTSLDIARRAVKGADVVLIATDVDAPGRELAEKFQNALKDQVGHLERMKFPYGHDVEYIDPGIIKNEIKNAIIRAGLSSLVNIKYFNELENELDATTDKLQELSLENRELLTENQNLLENLEKMNDVNQQFQDELKTLKKDSKTIKSEYIQLKSQYSQINEKNLLEVFSIRKLWREAFNEDLKEEDQLIFATNQFKPDNIVVGQGFISAQTKEAAIEWFKVIKTALIFIDPDKSEEMKEDLEEQEEDNSNNRFQGIWD